MVPLVYLCLAFEIVYRCFLLSSPVASIEPSVRSQSLWSHSCIFVLLLRSYIVVLFAPSPVASIEPSGEKHTLHCNLMVPLVYLCLAFEIVYRCFVCVITRCKHRAVGRKTYAVYPILMVPLVYLCLAFEIVYRCFLCVTRCKHKAVGRKTYASYRSIMVPLVSLSCF